MPSTTTTAICVLVALFLAYQLLRRYERQRDDKAFGVLRGCEPAPRLKNQRPLGVDRLEQIFRADAESRLMELFLFHFRQTGYTLEQKFLGTKAYGTIEPANMEAILSSQFKDFSFGPRRDITFPLFGDGIFTQEGPAWKHSRELLRPQFTHRQYEDVGVFHEHVENLLENIPAEGGLVDLQPLFFRLTLDVTTALLFGESVHSLKAPESAGEQTFADSFNIAQGWITKRFRLLDLYWLIGGKEFQTACNRVHDFADQILDRNLTPQGSSPEKRDERYVFLDTVAQSCPDRTALRHQILNILIAGRDTTACLLTWTFWLLARHPKVLEKLLQEIKVVDKDVREMTRTDLKNMTYLQNILKETLRLYPSVPVNTRTAVETTTLPTGGGPDRKSPVLIPKGSAVAYCVYAMHRRADLFGLDAEIFRPERWQEELPMQANKTNASWAYLPFNGGPRICLGMDFALTEAAYTIVHILQKFNSITVPEGQPVMDVLGTELQTMTLVIAPTEGCRVNMRKSTV